MLRRSISAVTCAALLGAAAPARVVRAAPPDVVAAAEALFRRGADDMLAGNLDRGCPTLAESYRLDPRPGTLFTLAECESRGHRIASAVAHYQDFIALVDQLSPAQRTRQRERRRVAEGQVRILAPDVPRLTLSLAAGAPAGTTIRRDGVLLGWPSQGVALPLDPGEHVILVEAPGAPARQVTVVLAPRESKELALAPQDPPPPDAPALAIPPGTALASAPGTGKDLTLHPKPAPVPPPVALALTPTPASSASVRRVGVGLVIAGSAAAIAGGALWFVAWRKVHAIDQDARDDVPFRDANGSFPTYEAVGLVLGAVGVAAATTGVVLTLRNRTPRADSVRVALRPWLHAGSGLPGLQAVF